MKNRSHLLPAIFAIPALLISLAFQCSSASAQVPWIWVTGADPAKLPSADLWGAPGVYGTQGVAAPGNTPGARYLGATWTDSADNLWLFGGFGVDINQNLGMMNDLWMFNPSTQLWTWFGGSPKLTCGSVVGAYCTQPPVYGTQGKPDPGNTPPGSDWATTWVDPKGKLWLFGGETIALPACCDYLNDLWVFDPSTLEWTWVAGSGSVPASLSEAGPPSVFGTMGTPAPGNTPGGRIAGTGWTDSAGNFWLAAGVGFDGNDSPGPRFDIWEYDTSLGQWAYMAGYEGAFQFIPGQYGTLGAPTPGDTPGARSEGMIWVDSAYNLWWFGGGGEDSLGQLGLLNDLWEYNLFTGNWTWEGGETKIECTLGGGQSNCGWPGTFGTQGVPSASNIPGAQVLAQTWTDDLGDVWMFGGWGYAEFDTPGPLNDLWEYQPFYNSWTYVAGGIAPGPGSSYGSLGQPGSPGGRQGQMQWRDADGTLWVFGGSGVGGNNSEGGSPFTGEFLNDLWSFKPPPSLPAAATPTFSVSGGTFTAYPTLTITDSSPGAVIYLTSDGTAPTSSSLKYSTPIEIFTSMEIQAIAVASGYSPSLIQSADYVINIPPTFALSSSVSALTINSGGQGTLTLTITTKNGFNSAVTFACSGLPTGATCSFNPSSVTPSISSSATTTLTIAASASASAAHPTRNPFLPAAGLTLAGCLLAFTRRRALRLWLVPLAALAVLGAFSACGGGGNPGGGGGGGGGGGPTTATVTVTATSGSIHQSTQITLTVN